MKKIKVLHLFSQYLNSTMNWAYRTIRHTPDIDVLIGAPLIIKNEFYDPEFTYLSNPFQITELKSEWQISTAQKFLAKAGNRSGLYQKFLLQAIKKHQPEIIHFHFGTLAAEHLSIFEEIDIPFVVTFYGFDYQSAPFTNRAIREKYPLMFAKASRVFCLGNTGKKMLIDGGCPEDKIRIVKLGIKPAEIPFYGRKRNKAKRFLQVGTFKEKKGIPVALEAFAKALKIFPDLKLKLIGEVQERMIYNQTLQFIKKHDLSKSISVQEMMTYSELISELEHHDIFIHPSQTSANLDCEGTPVVMMDAQASGLPVLSTFHADIPEVVVDGKTGFLTKEKDVEGLAANILRFREMQENELFQFRIAARAHIEKNYNIEVIGKHLKNMYDEILYKPT